jgi:hypothetical protein
MVGTNAIAGSNTNGVWYSTDSGTTWTQSTSSGSTALTFRSVYIVGTNAIAGSTSTGLWYSTNSGQTWIQSTSSGSTTRTFNSVYMVGTNAIAGSSSNGLWYSTNSGQTWTQSNLTTNTVNTVFMGLNDIAGGTNLLAYATGSSCYNEGTMVLTMKDGIEQFIKIENLRKGDLIKTYLHGYKPIDLIGRKNMFNNPKEEINSMYEVGNLIVSGGHYLLVDSIKSERKFYKQNMKIDDKYCLLTCDYDKAKKIIDTKLYTVYLLVLEGENERYGIYVNDNILSESTSKKNFLKHGFIQLE